MIDSIPQVQFVQIGQQPKNFKSFLRKFAEFSFYQTVLDSQISKYPLEFPAPFNYYQSTKNMTVKWQFVSSMTTRRDLPNEAKQKIFFLSYSENLISIKKSIFASHKKITTKLMFPFEMTEKILQKKESEQTKNMWNIKIVHYCHSKYVSSQIYCIFSYLFKILALNTVPAKFK